MWWTQSSSRVHVLLLTRVMMLPDVVCVIKSHSKTPMPEFSYCVTVCVCVPVGMVTELVCLTGEGPVASSF